MRDQIESGARLLRAALFSAWNMSTGRRCKPAPPAVIEIYGNGKPLDDPIPRIIWVYWHQAELPPLVQVCLKNTHRLNPNFEIRVLRPENLSDYIPLLPEQIANVNIEKRTDWIRLFLLSTYGGIWLDSTIILTRSLDWVIEQQVKDRSEFVGFFIRSMTLRPQHPVLESWFLASAAGSPFVANWFRVFHEKVILEGTSNYLASLRSRGVYDRILQGITSPEYLAVHVACQEVLQEGPEHRLSLTCAEESAYFYHEATRWRRSRLHNELLFKRAAGQLPTLIKIRGFDRRYLDRYLSAGLYVRESVIGRMFRS